MNPTALPPATDSLEVYFARQRAPAGIIYLATLALLLTGFASLPLVRVSVTVAAPGIVRPVGEKHEVRARTSGIAEAIQATRGQSVETDQMIVTLRADHVAEQRESLRRQIGEWSELIGDLEQLTLSDAAAFSPGDA